MSTEDALPQQLADFLGTWQVERMINDARSGQTLRAHGQATFTPDDAGMLYHEKLQLVVPGQAPMTATRRYTWAAAPGGVAVHFDDGRYFHHLALGQVAPTDHHACDPDSYEVHYDFARWPAWSATWRVHGPRKDYVMTSHYAAGAKIA